MHLSKISFRRTKNNKHLAEEVRQAFSENISHFCSVSAVICKRDGDKCGFKTTKVTTSVQVYILVDPCIEQKD